MRTAITGKHATIWSQTLFIALVYYVVGNIITISKLVGQQMRLALTVIGVVVAIMAVVALFYDRKQMEDDIGWSPSYMYFAAGFPGLLGVIAVSWYLAKRDLMYNTDSMSADPDSVEEDDAEEEEWDVSVDELEDES